MRPYALVAAVVLSLSAAPLWAQSVVATSNILVRALGRSIDFTSDTTTSIRDMKQIIKARDDAAGFVASGGALRTVQLEAAFELLRQQLPEAQAADDLALAEAIVAQ